MPQKTRTFTGSRWASFTILLSFALLEAFGSAPAWAQTPVGTEFQVNTYTTSGQEVPSVAADAAGNFVVVWGGRGVLGYGVLAQRFSSDGTTLGTEFPVSDSLNRGPKVASDSSGTFVVVWADSTFDVRNVFGRRFSSSGADLGTEFQVNTYTTDSQIVPAVASDASGSFVVVWSSRQDGSPYGIFGQRFASTGAAAGTEFQVNTYTTNNQDYSSVASDAIGNFVVVWTSQSTDVFGQRFSSSGARLGTEFQATSSPQDQLFPSVASDASGNFVVVWNSVRDYFLDVFGQRFSSSGAPLGSEFQVNTYTSRSQEHPSVSSDANGNFVVTWSGGYGQDGDRYGVFGQRFSSDGAKLGPEFRANSYTTDYQSLPSVASDASGEFVVVWQSSSQDGDSTGVFGQRFDTATPLPTETPTATETPTPAPPTPTDTPGTPTPTATLPPTPGVPAPAPAGSEFRVNSFTTSYQGNPAVASDNGGNFVVVWETNPQDGNFLGIFGKRFDAAGVPMGTEFRINSYSTGFQRQPSVASDVDGNFVVVWTSAPFGSQIPQDGSDYGVFGRRFDATGVPQGTEFPVNTYTTGRQIHPRVASDASGNFVVVWEYAFLGSGEPVNGSVQAQLFDASGTPQGTEFRVNPTDIGIFTDGKPAVSRSASGDFVVVWPGYTFPSSLFLRGRQFSAAGVALGTEFQVTGPSGFQGSVASDASGSFVVAWAFAGGGYSSIVGRRYSSAGAELGTEFAVSSYTTTTFDQKAEPVVASDRQGGFVVAWRNLDQDGSNFGIFGRRFDSSGIAAGTEFLVNSYTTNVQTRQDVAASPGGNFVVVWDSKNQDGSGYGVFLQRYGDLIFENGFESGGFTGWSSASTDGADPSVTPTA